MTPIEVLQSTESNPEQRIQAVFQLLRDDSAEAFAALSRTLREDTSPIVRHEAAYVLGEKGTDEAVQILIKSIREDPNDFVVHEAALALGNTRDNRARAVLTELLDHPMEDVRQTAQIAIQRLEPRDIEDPTSVILDPTQRAEDRVQASFRLLAEGSIDSVQKLIEAMHTETDSIVKHEIIFSLGETAADIVVPELCSVIENGDNRFVVHEAALALATIGNPSCEPCIRSLLTHENPDIVETAEIALLRLHS